jgi:hypothetical protein
MTSSPWRWVEHAGWVVFEDTFLLISFAQSVREMWDIARQRAQAAARRAQRAKTRRERDERFAAYHREP